MVDFGPLVTRINGPKMAHSGGERAHRFGNPSPTAPTLTSSVLQLIRVREGRTDKFKVDLSDDTRDITKIEGYIEESVKLLKGIEARSKAKSEVLRSLNPQLGDLDALCPDHDKSWGVRRSRRRLGELKKVNTRLQGECARLMAGKAELQAERSQLSATKAMLEVECARLKKGKDTAVAELVEARSRAKSVVEAAEAKTKEVELARDRLVTVLVSQGGGGHCQATDCDEEIAMKLTIIAHGAAKSIADSIGL
uniref:Uncharacterized protein n=1 Tax=Oryza brachyantha TaxID=4533 RepID=J3MK60_ORYBR